MKGEVGYGRVQRSLGIVLTSVKIIACNDLLSGFDKACNHIQGSHPAVDGKGPLGGHDFGKMVLYTFTKNEI